MTSCHDAVRRRGQAEGVRHRQFLEQANERGLPRRPGRVLVVDDEPLAGELLQRALSGTGFEPIVASSPHEAIEVGGQRPIALLVNALS
jgi:PleD family two-component response regulator